MKICESCLEAAREESEGYRLSATMVAKTLGAEIADHLCVARDEGLKCGCACGRNDVPINKSNTHPYIASRKYTVDWILRTEANEVETK